MSQAISAKKRAPARKPARKAVRPAAARRLAEASSASVIRFGLPEQSLTVGVEGPLKLRPAGRALLERLAGAVIRRIERVPEKTALDLLKQSTDAEMMVSFATTAAAFPELSGVRIDPLAKARARGMSLRQQTLARDDMLTLAQAAEALGLTAPAVNDRFRAGKLIALEGGARGRRYPAWQFDDEIAGKPLEAVLTALKGLSPWAAYRFFTTPDSTLEDETPLEALRRGALESAVSAAKLFAGAEQGGH